MKIIKDRHLVSKQSMFSGQEEVAKRIYRRVDDNNGCVWLIPINDPDPAANIHFDNPEDTNSRGYGGRTLSFDLEDGEVYKAKGPWHTNSNSLFGATRVDLRDKSLTQVVVGLDMSYDEQHRLSIENVIHLEEEPKAGLFNRGDIIASDFANTLERPVICFRQSRGGSSCGHVWPDGWTHEQCQEWHKKQN